MCAKRLLPRPESSVAPLWSRRVVVGSSKQLAVGMAGLPSSGDGEEIGLTLTQMRRARDVINILSSLPFDGGIRFKLSIKLYPPFRP